MNSLSIEITDKATSVLENFKEELESESVRHAAAGSAKRVFQAHFQALEASRPNQHNWPRQHFYASAARSVKDTVDEDGITIAIHKNGIAQRYFGGDIKPVNGKALAIPACAEAYGKRARAFNFLELVWPKGESVGMLVERQRTTFKIRKDRRKGKEGQTILKEDKKLGGKIFFWLVSSVHQYADPSVLPDNALVLDAVILEILNHIKTEYTR